MQKAEQKLILSTILRVLEAKGISKLALAKNIGVAPSTIARWCSSVHTVATTYGTALGVLTSC